MALEIILIVTNERLYRCYMDSNHGQSKQTYLLCRYRQVERWKKQSRGDLVTKPQGQTPSRFKGKGFQPGERKGFEHAKRCQSARRQ